MNAENRAFLNLVRLPGRLDHQQTAAVLGFSEHDIPILVKEKLLRPLGDPAANAPKYFSACHIEECARDSSWLDRASKTISRHWRRKNLRHPAQRASGDVEDHAIARLTPAKSAMA